MVQNWKQALVKESTAGMREKFGEPDIVGVIRGSRIRWAGYILSKNFEN